MKRLARCLCLALLVQTGLAQAQGHLASRRDKVPTELALLLRQGHCERAVAAMQTPLLLREPDVLVVAGWLSETGRCLERNVDKAWAYYEAAYEAARKAGDPPSVALRLAGLAARPEGGSDVAAVLWWARRLPASKGGAAAGDCDPFPGQDTVAEAAFLQSLQSWPQARLDACRAKVGFLSRVVSDLYYPAIALERELEGSVTLEFRLKEGEFTVTPTASGADPSFVQHVQDRAREAMTGLTRPTVTVDGRVNLVFRIE